MTDLQTTHGHDCWSWGPKHYECAIHKIKRLAEERIEMNDRIEELKKRGMITSLAKVPDAQNEGRAITAIEVTLFGRKCFLPADIAQEVERRLEAAEKVAEASRQLVSMYERATGLPCPPQLRRAIAALQAQASTEAWRELPAPPAIDHSPTRPASTEAEVEAAARRLNEELRAVGVYLGIDTRIRMARVVLEE